MSGSSKMPSLITVRKKTPEQPAAPRPVELLTLKQVATYLQVCTKTARKIICGKNIPIMRVGSQIRIRVDHLALFISKEW